MTQAVDILANTRIDKGYSLEEIAKITRLSLKYLSAIEAGDLDSLPPEPYNYLMIKDYAQFLGLKGEDLVRLYRRDYQRLPSKLAPARVKHQVTPNLLFNLLSLASLMVFIIYLLWQYYDYQRAPPLEVVWPSIELVGDSDIIVTGITDTEATVKVNDQLVIVSSEGHFEYRLKPIKPSTSISVVSTSISGKTTTITKIYRF
jgi:cytoskeletal protein RodZ